MYKVASHYIQHHEQVRQPQHRQLQQGDRPGDHEGPGQHGAVERSMNSVSLVLTDIMMELSIRIRRK